MQVPTVHDHASVLYRRSTSNNLHTTKNRLIFNKTYCTHFNIESLSWNQVNFVQLQHLYIVVICKISRAGTQPQMVPHWKHNVLYFETFGPLVLSSNVRVNLGLIR